MDHWAVGIAVILFAVTVTVLIGGPVVCRRRGCGEEGSEGTKAKR